jgi:hypothetical protein
MRILRLTPREFLLFFLAVALPCAVLLLLDFEVTRWFDHLS